MMYGSKMRKVALAAPVLALAIAASSPTFATSLFSQGFETDSANVFGVTRVTSGTNGVTSATGSYHAESPAAIGGSPAYRYTNWGGYYTSTGGSNGQFQPYTTSIDIYLDLSAGASNDTRFDFSSAIDNQSGTFLRDFAFNAGFYNSADATGPGAGTDRFVIGVGNTTGRANSYPKNPASPHDPIAISTSGWYTFQEDFTDNAGTLAVVMSILDSGGGLINQWTLSTPGDLTATVVGGNLYGWMVNNEFAFLAIDNLELTGGPAAVPLPATLPLFASGLGALGLLGWRRKRKNAASSSQPNQNT